MSRSYEMHIFGMPRHIRRRLHDHAKSRDNMSGRIWTAPLSRNFASEINKCNSDTCQYYHCAQ